MSAVDFDTKCMYVIEMIVSINEKNTREDAIVIAQKQLEKVNESGEQDYIAVYERVLKKLQCYSDYEYELIKKRVFDI